MEKKELGTIRGQDTRRIMCGDCVGFCVNRKPVVRSFVHIMNDSPLMGGLFGNSPLQGTSSDGAGLADPQQIFTCFNCWCVKDSLWIVSHVVDLAAVDECLCCAECLCRNLTDPAFARERRITLRCGGDGCHLQLDTWTKGSALVISLVKEHTVNCPFRPVFCPKGCKAVLRRQEQSLHEGSCPLSPRRFENESQRMEEVEKRLIVPSSQMRYHQLANVPTTTVRKDAWSPSQPADPHETLRQEAINVSRRSSVVPVPERQPEASPPGSRSGTRNGQNGNSIRREALEVSRRSSLQSLGRSLSEADGKHSNGRPNGSPTSRTNGMSDETLEQLEKARLALERECIEIPEGVSYLPDVVAQRINNEDVELRDRVEKLEDLVATTRAQLEKAFAENRNLRALLASEHKLRELHVTKLRDEVEILRSMVFRSLRPGSNGGSTTSSSSTLNNVNYARGGRESSLD